MSIGRETAYINFNIHLSKKIEEYTTLEQCGSYFNLVEGTWNWKALESDSTFESQ